MSWPRLLGKMSWQTPLLSCEDQWSNPLRREVEQCWTRQPAEEPNACSLRKDKWPRRRGWTSEARIVPRCSVDTSNVFPRTWCRFGSTGWSRRFWIACLRSRWSQRRPWTAKLSTIEAWTQVCRAKSEGAVLGTDNTQRSQQNKEEQSTATKDAG